MASLSGARNIMALKAKKKKIQGRVLYGRTNRSNLSNNSRSFSQSMISQAVHQRKVKSLLHNNKALAKTLEFTQCDLQYKEKMISSLQQALTQHMVLRLKVKEMSKTAEKLIEEVQDVNNYLDFVTAGKQGDLSKNNLLPTELVPECLSELDDLDTINEAANSEPIVKETSESDAICATPKRASSLQLPRLDIQNMEKRPGVCDLTAINEVSLVAEDHTLPPLLFVDEDIIKKKSSVGANSKTSDSVDRTPELIISSSYSLTKPSDKTNDKNKVSCLGTRKSSRESYGTTSATGTKIPRKKRSSGSFKINEKTKSLSNSLRSNKDRRSSITTRSSKSVNEQVQVDEKISDNCSINAVQDKVDLNPSRKTIRSSKSVNEQNQVDEKIKDNCSINALPDKVDFNPSRKTFVVNAPIKSPEKLIQKNSRATFVVNTASKSPTKLPTKSSRGTFVIDKSLSTEINNADDEKKKTIVRSLKNLLSPVKSPIRSPKNLPCYNDCENNLKGKSDGVIAGLTGVTPPATDATIIFQEDMELTEVINVLPPVIGEMHNGLSLCKPINNTTVPALGTVDGNIDILNKVNEEMKQNNQNAISGLTNTEIPVEGSKKNARHIPLPKDVPLTKKKKEQNLLISPKCAKNNNKVPQYHETKLQDPVNEPEITTESELKTISKSSKPSNSKNHRRESLAVSADSVSDVRESSTEIPESENVVTGQKDKRRSILSMRSSSRLKRLPKKSYAFLLSSESESDSSIDREESSKAGSPGDKGSKNQKDEKQKKFFLSSKKSLHLASRDLTSSNNKTKQDHEKCPKTDIEEKMQSSKRKSLQTSVNTKRSKISIFSDELFQSDSDSDFCSFSSDLKKAKKRTIVPETLNNQNSPLSGKSKLKNPVAVGCTNEKLKDSNNLMVNQGAKETLDHGNKKKPQLNNEIELDVDQPSLNINRKISGLHTNKMSHLIYDDPGIHICKGDKYLGTNANNKEGTSRKKSMKPHIPKLKKTDKNIKEKKIRKEANIVHNLDSHVIHDIAIVHASENEKHVITHGSSPLKASNNCNTRNKDNNEHSENNKQITHSEGSWDMSTVDVNHPEKMQPVVILQDTFASNKDGHKKTLFSGLKKQSSGCLKPTEQTRADAKTSSNSENKSNEENATDCCHRVELENYQEEGMKTKRRSKTVSYKEPKLNCKMRR